MSTEFDPALFRETLGHYPTGVAVVTAIGERGEPIGMVVGTFSSVSLDPPLVAFFPMSGSRSFALIREAPTFCINVLASDQEPLCRQLATRGENKFDGVGWRPAPLGSPILDGAVSWIECSFDDIREAGDHYIVLGRVLDFSVARSTLPLLFFQGGYGRFSPRSFVATPDPELIRAAQVAETIRTEVESLSEEFTVNCSVLAKIRTDAVQVLADNRSPVAEPFPLGHRQPLIPPFGAVYMVNSPTTEVDAWLQRSSDTTEAQRDLNLALLDKVRERGYSLLTAKPEALQQHEAVLAAFEQSDRLPRHERAVRESTSELAAHFTPDLLPGRRYDLATIVVPIPTAAGDPPLALRMTGLPASVATEQVEHWIHRMHEVAAAAGRTS